MLPLLPLILIFSIICGQLIKIPLPSGGLTLLDITVVALDIYALTKIKNQTLKFPLWFKLVLLFSLIGFISLLLSPLKLNLAQFLISFSYNLRFLAYFSLGYFLTLNIFPSIKKNIFKILVFSGIILAILGLLQFIFIPSLIFLQPYGWDPHYYRAASTFLDPNFLGAYLGLTLVLIFQNPQKIFSQKFQIIFFALVYLCLLLTFSRSGYLMFITIFAVFAFLRHSFKTFIFSTILFLILLFSFQIYIVLVNRSIDLDRSQTASYRLSTWRQGIEIFQKSPILGIGFNAYNFALRQYNLGDEHFLEGKGATSNDSSLLFILSTTGIVGFLIYFLFIIEVAKKSLLKNPLIIASIIGILIHSLFLNSLFYPFIMIWITLMISTLNEY